VRNFQLLLAVSADAAHETLGANEVHRCATKRLDSHIHQTADRRRRVVGVQRGQHQVASKRGLDPDFRRFKIANLTDQNNVGILARNARSAAAKFSPICSFICT